MLAVTTYTTKKEAQRIEEIKRRAAAAVKDATTSYKFIALERKAFGDGNADEWKEYINAVDSYHKALYTGVTGQKRDNHLVLALHALCLNVEDIEKVKHADVHKALSKAVLDMRQKMNADAREELKILNERLNQAKAGIKLENGLPILDENGNAAMYTEAEEDEKDEAIQAIKDDIAALKASNVYTAAKLSQVGANQFRRKFEFFIGSFLNGDTVVSDYVTLEEREVSGQWKRWKKQAEQLNIPAEKYEEYFKTNDKASMKALIKEKREEAKAAKEEPKKEAEAEGEAK